MEKYPKNVLKMSQIDTRIVKSVGRRQDVNLIILMPSVEQTLQSQSKLKN